jgi:hypothetical protein
MCTLPEGGYTVFFWSVCINTGVFTMLLLQFCYAGYKIARNPRFFIASIWLFFFVSIILFLGYYADYTYNLTESFCKKRDIEWFPPHWVLNAGELMGILGLWTFAYHYFSTTAAVK